MYYMLQPKRPSSGTRALTSIADRKKRIVRAIIPDDGLLG
jgi:hypothetical protein